MTWFTRQTPICWAAVDQPGEKEQVVEEIDDWLKEECSWKHRYKDWNC